MRAPVPVALFGLGRMGKIYASTLAEMPDAELRAVVSLDIEAEAPFLAEVGHPRAVDDPSDALNGVDAVVIATPTSTHRNLVETAAAAGKAIFCEKPLALSVVDTLASIDAAEGAGVALQVGFMRRFDRPFVEAKAAIDAGRIGKPVTFKSVGRDPVCPDPMYADPTHSGGLIVDMAIHDFDLARWLMNSEIERVSAEGTTLVCTGLHAVGDIDNAVVNLRFQCGGLGQIEVSRNAIYGYDIRTEVLGSEGAVRIGHTDHGTEMLAEPSDRLPTDYLSARFGEAYRKQLHGFIRSLREEIDPKPTGRDALAAFEAALAATYAMQSGGSVSLEQVRSGWTPSSAAV